MKRLLTLFALAALCCHGAFASDQIQKLEELHRKAEEQIILNQLRDAMDTYQEILFLEPDDETAYANMGQLYLIFGDFKKAEAAFQNTLSIDPDNETALSGLKKIKDPDDSFYLETDPGPHSRSGAESSADRKD